MPTAHAQNKTIPFGLWKLFALTRDDDGETSDSANQKAIRTLPHAERIVDMLREGCSHEMLNEELQRAMETAYPDDEHETDFGYPLRSAFFVGIATAWLLAQSEGGAR